MGVAPRGSSAVRDIEIVKVSIAGVARLGCSAVRDVEIVRTG
jgi:hypothetical protein